MTVTSALRYGPEQGDGRRYVYETHTAEDGRVFTYDYLHDGVQNPEYVLEARAALINKELAEREAARVFVMGTSVPLSKHDFIARFTPTEYASIEVASESDPIIKMFLLRLNSSGAVYHHLAMQGLSYLEYIGLLSSARVAQIGAPW